MDRVDQRMVDSDFQTSLENFGKIFFQKIFRELHVGSTEKSLGRCSIPYTAL